MKQTIVYTLSDARAPMHSDNHIGHTLTARTDTGARRQARRIAKGQALRAPVLTFHRLSDGCRGQIDL